jgi:hypothetical protein
MDVSSALKNEIFRPLATVIVPGGFAVAPFILVTANYVPYVIQFLTNHPTAFSIAIFLAIIAAGLVLEDIGSSIEVLWDRLLSRKFEDRKSNWEQYLKLKMSDEYVGQRYLRTIFVRFKFELSMAPALLVFLCGLLWLNAIYSMWQPAAMSFISVLIAAIASWLLRESYNGACLLGELHLALVEAVKSSAPQADDTKVSH